MLGRLRFLNEVENIDKLANFAVMANNTSPGTVVREVLMKRFQLDRHIPNLVISFAGSHHRVQITEDRQVQRWAHPSRPPPPPLSLSLSLSLLISNPFKPPNAKLLPLIITLSLFIRQKNKTAFSLNKFCPTEKTSFRETIVTYHLKYSFSNLFSLSTIFDRKRCSAFILEGFAFTFETFIFTLENLAFILDSKRFFNSEIKWLLYKLPFPRKLNTFLALRSSSWTEV